MGGQINCQALGGCYFHCMKRRHFSAAVLLLASGCAPLTTYYRPGVSVARLNADLTGCEVAALRDAPVATEIRRSPPTFVPGERICNSDGSCYQRPGYWIEGPIYTVDVNEGLRNRVETYCMAGKGYERVTIPRCSEAVVRAAPPGVTTTLPRLTQSACMIPRDGGKVQIVNPVTPTSSG